jgi:hypothetical protein
VHLCPPYFSNSSSVDDSARRRGILYHEFTHKYASTDDVGYYFGTSSGLPIYTKNGTSSKGTLTTSELLRNADTYEMFLLDTSRYSGDSYITRNE